LLNKEFSLLAVQECENMSIDFNGSLMSAIGCGQSVWTGSMETDTHRIVDVEEGKIRCLAGSIELGSLGGFTTSLPNLPHDTKRSTTTYLRPTES
jgi:hypothetical protein